MKTKRILSVILSLVMVVSAMALITANAEQDPLYAVAKDGDLLYEVDFGDVTNQEWYNDCGAGTNTASADGKSITASHPDTTGGNFYGPKLTQYEFPGYVYTLEFWCEVSDPLTTRVGMRLVRATDGATYGFFTKKDEYYASATGIRNGTAQHMLDGDLWRFHEGTNNRQYFRVVVDGVNGTLTFYAKEADGKHDYKYMGIYENIPNTPNEEQPSYITACLWLWDAGTVSVGDFKIYKGNIQPAVEETTEEVTTAAATTVAVTTAVPDTKAPETKETVETTAAPETEAEDIAAAPATEAPATEAPAEKKSGCGASAAAGIVALVSILGCAAVYKKH